ncbi:MAG: molybdopterin molybdotransferase MoeA [Clostridium sp.]|nr:molybdopterin molybdotransferase MoeA [Clostridium sp.]
MIRVQLEKAIQLMLDSINEIEETEKIDLLDANGRVLAEDIYASINNPPFNKSPLDGYALIASDTKGATKENPVKLKVIDEVFAGGFSTKEVRPGEAVRIMTGAKIPKGANCILMQELTDEGMDIVEIYKELSDYANFCFEGEDIEKGTLLMKKGEVLSCIHQGVISSMGIDKVLVKKIPTVALFVTGDEVSKSGSPLLEGKIYDSNRQLMYSRLTELGVKPKYVDVLGDDPRVVSNKLIEVIDKVDLVITTGGVSVGKKDIFHEVVTLTKANRLFWKVDLMPGTPAMYYLLKNKPVLSLSGNPFAALTTFELLGRPVLAKLTGNKNMETKRVEATLMSDFTKKSKTRRFIRGKYNEGIITLTSNKHASGMLASMIGCNAFIDIDAGNEGLHKGEKVKVVLL